MIVAVFGELGENFVGRVERDGSLPRADGAMVERRVVGERLIGNVGDELAVMADAQARLGLDGADDDGVESPLGEDAQDFVFAAFFGDEQHALLAFGEHDLVGAHAGFALRHEVELDIEADAAARAHLAGGAGEAGSAHVLNADDGAGLHGFKAGFEEQLFHERVADLDVGALLLGAFVELFAGHGGAVNAVAAGLCAHIDDRVAGAGGLGVEDFVFADEAESEGVDQRIAAVAGLEFGFAAEVGHAEAVAVAGDAADDAFEDGVILVMSSRLFTCCVGDPWNQIGDGAEAERIHDGERPRAHGEDVAQNAADAGGRALVGLDVAGVVVRLDLEGAGPAVAHVDDAGVFAGPLHDAIAFGGQALEMHAARLVGAVLAPHHAVDAEFGEGWRAAKSRENAVVLLRSDAVLGQQLRGDGDWLRNDCGGGSGHRGCLHCRIGVLRAVAVWRGAIRAGHARVWKAAGGAGACVHCGRGGGRCGE